MLQHVEIIQISQDYNIQEKGYADINFVIRAVETGFKSYLSI